MKTSIKYILISLLKELIEDIKDDKFECNDEQIETSINLLKEFRNDKIFSKSQACSYLNVSRSAFDGYIRNGLIPKGEKRLGFKELSWKKEDLDNFNK